ncbi:uncharacterized protein KY384_007777 [Bacidia gigantensis]|uniref:uncharacterized protein n=1 Tax=Bacidia gigantensis TaxID=2732470 RepID=UPI001D058B47|nr:uncharacterized protein KY384_007777 [Bacidia gigantensis]KAG8527624.1 hypothetical protein KY384_007777 [Bacidia gigantensis]
MWAAEEVMQTAQQEDALDTPELTSGESSEAETDSEADEAYHTRAPELKFLPLSKPWDEYDEDMEDLFEWRDGVMASNKIDGPESPDAVMNREDGNMDDMLVRTRNITVADTYKVNPELLDSPVMNGAGTMLLEKDAEFDSKASDVL